MNFCQVIIIILLSLTAPWTMTMNLDDVTPIVNTVIAGKHLDMKRDDYGSHTVAGIFCHI